MRFSRGLRRRRFTTSYAAYSGRIHMHSRVIRSAQKHQSFIRLAKTRQRWRGQCPCAVRQGRGGASRRTPCSPHYSRAGAAAIQFAGILDGELVSRTSHPAHRAGAPQRRLCQSDCKGLEVGSDMMFSQARDAVNEVSASCRMRFGSLRAGNSPAML